MAGAGFSGLKKLRDGLGGEAIGIIAPGKDSCLGTAPPIAFDLFRGESFRILQQPVLRLVRQISQGLRGVVEWRSGGVLAWGNGLVE